MTRLLGEDAKEVQRINMVWLRREHLPVEGLGIRQAAGAVMLEREIEGLGNGHIADWSEGQTSQTSRTCRTWAMGLHTSAATSPDTRPPHLARSARHP